MPRARTREELIARIKERNAVIRSLRKQLKRKTDQLAKAKAKIKSNRLCRIPSPRIYSIDTVIDTIDNNTVIVASPEGH
eukprot:8990169-Pyramimonas_sp.AAC.1